VEGYSHPGIATGSTKYRSLTEERRLGSIGPGYTRSAMGDKTTRSCLEEQMFGYLTSLGVPFSEQYPTRSGFVMDFLVELSGTNGNTKIDLEVDGSPWHSSASQRKRDRFRDNVMRDTGYEVLRFKEGFTQRFVEEQIHEVCRRCGCTVPGRPGINMVGHGVVWSGKAGRGLVWPGEAGFLTIRTFL
jgi:very-short-patch-repair endonuclease